MTAPRLLAFADLGHDPGRVRDVAERILADPAFDTERSMVDRALDRFLEFLAELFDRTLAPIVLNELTAWIVAAVAVVLLVLAVWRWTRGTRLDASTAPEPTDTAGRTSEDWRGDAASAHARGELSVALRWYYLAIVADLEDAGWLEPLPGRTIRELDRELAHRWPAHPEAIATVGRRVEEVIFGGAQARPEDLDLARSVEEIVRRTPARVAT